MKTLTLAASTPASNGTDHYAAVNVRREEMLRELHGKENELRARAADLHTQAKALHDETNEKARTTNDVHGVTEARARVNRLLEEERRLLNIELPKLQAESASIASGTHLTMVTLTQVAQNRIAADLQAKLDGIANRLDAARHAFDTHLAEIATPETLALAQAFTDACQVAGCSVGYTMQVLLAARSKAAA